MHVAETRWGKKKKVDKKIGRERLPRASSFLAEFQRANFFKPFRAQSLQKLAKLIVGGPNFRGPEKVLFITSLMEVIARDNANKIPPSTDLRRGGRAIV